MSVVVVPDGASVLEPPPFPIHRFTVAEYEELGRLGILTEDSNVELLDGWIVPKMTKHPPHDGTIDILMFLLMRTLPLGWFPRCQNVIATTDSQPEPDVAVVRGQPGDYRQRHPTGSDVALIVEVADSTVQRDRDKAPIYARAGIPHYWLVNLDQLQIEVFSQPAGKGPTASYQTRRVLRGSELLAVIVDEKEVGAIAAEQLLS